MMAEMADEGHHLFISDLHLTAEHPDTTRSFRRFLETHARGAASLYILGDFFDVWIGDDADTPLIDEVTTSLAELVANGTRLYLMHGNRDFLIGTAFTQRCGARLIAEPYRLILYGRQYLLMHGDVLCTDDHDYQAFRRMVRDPGWQREFLARPLAERQAFAEEARRKSRSMNSNKPEDIMDVNLDAVKQLVSRYGCDCLIHGHTHRPAVHDVHLPERTVQRVVLGDWDRTEAFFLRIGRDGENLLSWPLQYDRRPASP